MLPIPLFDNLSCKGRAYVTWTLIWLNMLAFVFLEWPLSSSALSAFLIKWALVPGQFTHALVSGSLPAIAMALLTMVTCSFLHGGWMHIIGNMVFLQAVGRSLEARMGSLAFALFYFLGCFASWGMFVYSDPTSTIPALGASGAIAALLGAYLVFFPMAKIRAFLLVAVFPLFLVTWAWNLFLVWFAVQFASGIASIVDPSAVTTVALFAHFGGFVFGVIVAGIWRLVSPTSDICYVPISCGGDTTAGKQMLRLWLPRPLKDRLPKRNKHGKDGHDCDCEHKQD